MESDAEDIENIFEEYENNENVAEVENTENNTANETPGAVKIAAPKRAVKNPRLKFNGDRLCGERGIPILMSHFKNVKFKGLHHEKEDLDMLMSKLEHWTHRLMPSMKFEDCLAHIERLGRKRQVQTCLRKIRLDMPILNSDFVKDNEEDNVKRNEDSQLEEMDPFDRLLGQSQEASNVDVSALEDVSNSSFFHSSPQPNDNSGHVLGSSFGSSMTSEQKERMERNRMLAAERRKARLAAMKQNSEGLHSENKETNVCENAAEKVLPSSECNEGNIENDKFDSGVSHLDENLNNSVNFNNENSEKLGLDDLMNLVDEEDPEPSETAVASQSDHIEAVSSNISDIGKFPSDEAQNLQNFENIPENSENPKEESLSIESSLDLIRETSVDYNVNSNNDIGKSPSDEAQNLQNFENISENTENPKEESLNIESSLDLINETSVDSNVNSNNVCSFKNTLIREKNSAVECENSNSMHFEEENYCDDSVNINKIDRFPSDDPKNFKSTDNVSGNSENKISIPNTSEKFLDKNLKTESGISDNNRSAMAENEEFIPMDCDDEIS